MFINLHVLFTFAAGNPNCDDTGAGKTVSYGAVTRSRISSSAMTRPKRLGYEAECEDRTYRSRSIAALVAESVGQKLKLKPSDPLLGQITQDADDFLRSLTTSSDKTAKKRQAKEASDAENHTSGDSRIVKDTAIWLSNDEVENLSIALARKWGKGGDRSQEIDRDAVLSDGASSSLSIAMFGRMFANAPQHDTEAACQRSHAFTTHAIEPEIDLITAVDDLNAANESGAAFVGQQQLTGGVYYWHANINTRDLARSWNLPADKAAARTRLITMLESLILRMPDGRANSTAINSTPRMVFAVPATMGASYQAAYEAPVEDSGNGYLIPSEQRLLREYEQTRQFAPRQFVGNGLLAVLDDTGLTIPKKTVGRVNLDEMTEALADMILNALDTEEAK